MEGQARGFSNCLLLDLFSNVAEFGNSNVFMAKDDVVYTRNNEAAPRPRGGTALPVLYVRTGEPGKRPGCPGLPSARKSSSLLLDGNVAIG